MIEKILGGGDIKVYTMAGCTCDCENACEGKSNSYAIGYADGFNDAKHNLIEE